MKHFLIPLIFSISTFTVSYSQNTISISKKETNPKEVKVKFGGNTDGTVQLSGLKLIKEVKTTDENYTIVSFDLFYATENGVVQAASKSSLITPVMRKIIDQLKRGEEFTLGNVKVVNSIGEIYLIEGYRVRVI